LHPAKGKRQVDSQVQHSTSAGTSEKRLDERRGNKAMKTPKEILTSTQQMGDVGDNEEARTAVSLLLNLGGSTTRKERAVFR
jgi:hypothetical protein